MYANTGVRYTYVFHYSVSTWTVMLTINLLNFLNGFDQLDSFVELPITSINFVDIKMKL
jgi:hypothetical protein